MGILEERDFTCVPTIPEFYKGKSIFITGGSGFMGKVLIEKLLYSCSDLDTIYLLMRSKRGVDCEERLANLYSSVIFISRSVRSRRRFVLRMPRLDAKHVSNQYLKFCGRLQAKVLKAAHHTGCFDRLRREKPTIFKTKIVVIPGDIMKSGLGISEEDRTMLINRVNIVFHAAASVRFDDSLKYAVRMNLNGTNKVLELAMDMRNLCAFIHVSTAYSNTHKNVIEEIMYPPHADVKDTLAICETLDEHTLKVITPKYLGEAPNTYVFSKQLAEHLVYEKKGQLPAVIVRPSIVISSFEEPVPGYIENFNGPIGLSSAGAKGLMKILYGNPYIVNDYMPVDVSIRSIIVAAWSRGTIGVEPLDHIPIYNICNKNIASINLKDMIDFGKQKLSELPAGPSLWHPFTWITQSKTLYFILMVLLQLLPALILDIILRAFSQKPMLVKIQRRIYNANMVLQYYVTQEWCFDNKNYLLLRSCIKDEDLKSFNYDIENIDISNYFENSMLGVRRYLFKEKDEDLPKHRAIYWRMYYLHIIVTGFFCSYALWWILNSKYVQNILINMINFN